jgi:glycosyltransferase involved in cell wall biosynthesis
MTILFDANPIATDKKTGVGHYTAQLLKSLAEHDQDDIQIVAYYYNFLGRKKYSLPNNSNITYKQIRFIPVQLVNLLRRLYIEIPLELLTKKRGDIAIFPNFIAQPSLFKTPKYIVLHDLAYLEHPEYVSDKNRRDLLRFVPKSIKRSKKIITVSEVSKNTIATYYAIAPIDIIVTPIPPEKRLELTTEEVAVVLSDYAIERPYLLYIGTLEPRKNIIGLVEAFANTEALSNKYTLVFAGKMDWKYEEIASTIKQKQEEGFSIIYCGYVSDVQKAALYSKASVFVLPSFYEGFGMMILESMQYNVPLAISDIPVFHEVAKNSATYFNPNDPIEIGNVISAVLQNNSETTNITKTYSETLRTYSWKKNAQIIMSELVGR